MSTSRKTTTKAPAKKAPAKKVVSKKVAPKKQAEFSEPTYAMTREVKEWIERANSTIQHLKGKVERLERENKELKAYRRWAEQRILRSEHE